MTEHITPAQLKSRKGSSDAHSALVSACMAYLKLRRTPACRMYTGARLYTEKDGSATRRTNPDMKGMPDIIACLPNGWWASIDGCWLNKGRTVWIECKTGKAVQAPHQKARAAEWQKAGALVLIVRSVADLEAAL